MVAERTLEKLGVRIDPHDDRPLILCWRRKNGRLEQKWQAICREYRYPLEAAVRQQEHILRGYGFFPGEPGETQELELLLRALDKINWRLAAWSALTGPEKQVIRRQLELFGCRLERAVNPRKVKARQKIGAAGTLKDRLDRPNPGAARAEIASAAALIARRLGEEIEEAIVPLIILRRQALLLERDRMRQAFAPVARALNAMFGSVQWREGRLEPLFQRVLRLGADLARARVRFKPYRDQRQAVQNLLISAQRRLALGDQDTAERLLYQAGKQAEESVRLLKLPPSQFRERFESMVK